MIELVEQDYIPLETFRLIWRWTDPRWNVLPQDALNDIRPLTESKAAEIHTRTLAFHPDTGFTPGRYELADQLETSDKNVAQVGNWLRSQVPELAESIVLSWNQEDALVTTAATFCDFWDDFCYPASDDIVISPLSEAWMLVWWHEEVFFFGVA